jgi:hypothetical protein
MKILEPASVYHSNGIKGSSFYKKIHSKTLLHALTEQVTLTDSMKLGSAVHCAILEPEKFASEFLVSPKFDRRTSAGKAAAAEWETIAAGKTCIDSEEMAMIESMKAAIMCHPIAKNMLTGGEAEYSYYAEDPETGVKLKCRPDYHKAGALIDLKTTADASFEGFARQIGNLGYHLQAAFYLDTFNYSQGTDYKEFFFIALENKAPHAIAVYRLDENHISAGRKAYKKALQRYSEFLKSGASVEDLQALRNFGYPTDIIDIQVPYYILDKIEIA